MQSDAKSSDRILYTSKECTFREKKLIESHELACSAERVNCDEIGKIESVLRKYSRRYETLKILINIVRTTFLQRFKFVWMLQVTEFVARSRYNISPKRWPALLPKNRFLFRINEVLLTTFFARERIESGWRIRGGWILLSNRRITIWKWFDFLWNSIRKNLPRKLLAGTEWILPHNLEGSHESERRRIGSRGNLPTKSNR